MQKALTLLLILIATISLQAQQTQGVNCSAPGGLNATAITTTSAQLNWVAAPSALTYDLRYRAVGQPNWVSGGTFNNDVTSTTVNSLVAATNYEFQLQSNCPGPSVSGYSASGLFTTLCNGVQPSVITPVLNTTVCLNSTSIQLSASPAGGTFAGSITSNGLFIPNVAGVGTHVITYIPPNNCSTSSTITFTVISAPGTPAEPAGNVNACSNGENITYTILPVNGATDYTWSFTPANSGFLTANDTAATLDWDPTFCGQVSVRVVANNGCGISLQSAAHVVTVNCPPLPVIVPSGPYCYGDTAYPLAANIQGGFWSGCASNSGTFNPAIAGVGQCTITYTAIANGCVGMATSNVTVLPLPQPNITTPAVHCENTGVLQLAATPTGGTFLPNDTLTTATPGNYTFTYSYTDQNGCTGIDTSIQIVNPGPTAQFSYVVNCNNVCFTDESQSPGTWSWNYGDFLGANTPNPCHNYDTIATYCVTLTVTNSCGLSDTTVCLDIPCIATGITEQLQLADLALYPNPTNGLLNINFTSAKAQNYQVEIVDATGKLLYREQLNNYVGQYNNPLNMAGYAKGMYILSITGEDGAKVNRKIARE